jgi:hypothetical protein
VALEPFRFIHAANVFADHQLRDTGPLPASARAMVRDATLDAFDRLVGACIEREIDFLLLAGNTFDESDRSLRAELALFDGFRRLAEHEIPVLILPGHSDPPSAWSEIPGLPENATLLSATAGDSAHICRDGEVIATISARDPLAKRTRAAAPGRCSTGDSVSDAFAIETFSLQSEDMESHGENDAAAQHQGNSRERGLPAHGTRRCDYLALACGHHRRSFALNNGLAHSPGGTQGLSPHSTGPHGCTLVEVDAAGTVQCTFVATAPVRWESFPLSIGPSTTAEELATAMRDAISACRCEDSEKLWLVGWQVQGWGPVFDELMDSGFRTSLAESIANLPASENVPLIHAFRLSPGSKVEAARADQASPLASEYFYRLRDVQPLDGKFLEAELAGLHLGDGEMSRVRALIAGMDYRAVSLGARRHGTNWFAAAAD